MNGWIAGWTERLRRHLLEGLEGDVARLESALDGQRREIEAQRDQIEAQREALGNPETWRPLIVSALRREAERSGEPLAALLRPLVDEMMQEKARQRSRQRRRVAGSAAALATAGAAGFLFWQSDLRLVPLAAARPSQTRLEPVARPSEPNDARASAAPQKPRAVLEEQGDGFGLAQAVLSDPELAAAVRTRLSACPELAGAEVSFSVREGWVWLRGRASERGREAATTSLGDLGDGVLVVNQIDAAHPDQLVER